MYINNRNRLKFKFWRRFLGTSLALFFVSLTQEYLKSAELFVAIAVFLGYLSVVAIYIGTELSGVKKFLKSAGFIALVGSCASSMLMLSCYLNDLYLCEPRPFQSTIVAYFIMPFTSIFIYLLTLFLGSFSKKRYRA